MELQGWTGLKDMITTRPKQPSTSNSMLPSKLHLFHVGKDVHVRRGGVRLVIHLKDWSRIDKTIEVLIIPSMKVACHLGNVSNCARRLYIC